jgi:hypothetical protein
MSVSVGGCVGAASPQDVSEAASGKDQIKGEAAVSILKKAMQADADTIKTLIASATGVGQKLDVNG